ncbi:unnamed protein product [Symbiodinium sp. CCMP2592]|nr:unnamed protein product [Symbiodinium sp. CCMP2592]
MGSAEATSWLRELIEEEIGADAARKLRAHSCKVTLLTWAGQSGRFSREERTLLGHHAEATTRSATYDRDAVLALHSKVFLMLQDISAGLQEPDAPAARKLLSMELITKEEFSHNKGKGNSTRLLSIGDRVHYCGGDVATVEGFDEEGDVEVVKTGGVKSVWFASKCIQGLGPLDKALPSEGP